MNRVLNVAAMVISMVLFLMCGRLNAAVVNITQGSTTGYTMTDGNTYVVKNSVSFSNSTAGGSGITIADGATVVIYIPTNVTLTATGANGSGRTGGGAGIHVPETATLVLTGEGEVNATGGNAGNGSNGSNGSKGGAISCRYGNYPFNTGTTACAEGAAAKGNSGAGGAGGGGGGGAGAAIGGLGGEGGTGRSAGTSIVVSGYVLNFHGNGRAGGNGMSGTASSTMGTCYIPSLPVCFLEMAVLSFRHAGDAHFPSIISCDYTSECLDGRLDGGQVSFRVDLRRQFHAKGRQYAPDVLPG